MAIQHPTSFRWSALAATLMAFAIGFAPIAAFLSLHDRVGGQVVL